MLTYYPQNDSLNTYFNNILVKGCSIHYVGESEKKRIELRVIWGVEHFANLWGVDNRTHVKLRHKYSESSRGMTKLLLESWFL